MTPELEHIKQFIASHVPFDELPEERLERMVAQLEVIYYRQGSVLEQSPGLRIIRSGAAELRDQEHILIDKCQEGSSFNLQGLNLEHPGIRATFIEDSLIYYFPEEGYQALRKQQREIDRFFHSQRSRRIRRAARYQPKPHDMMRTIEPIMSKDILSVSPDTSISETAFKMSERRLSSILIMQNEELIGIVTDRDLRSRVIAQGIPYHESINTVMTPFPKTVDMHHTIFDTTLLMTENNIHHLPVMSSEKVVGMITASDLMLAKEDDPVFIVQHIKRQNHISDIKTIVAGLHNLFAQWITSGIRAHQLSHILTAISDAVCRRIIELTIAEIGPAPAPFAWLGFGSQGRKEQMLNADQDNGLLLSNIVTEDQLPWFEILAQKVCDGLHECGYVYCPGDIMASNPAWRMSLERWKSTVTGWTQTPTPKAVMHVSIFFDIRCIYGDSTLSHELQQHMLYESKRNSIFLAALAQSVLDSDAPLGIFRRFVVERNGEHRDQLNLKKRGILPLVETIRLHALAHAIAAINTFDRLTELKQKKVLTMVDARNIEDALRFIMQLRCEHQAKQILNGDSPSHFISPKDLSELEKKQLKDAFDVVNDCHQGVKSQFRHGLD